jgi:heat shock protein HspQ
MTLRTKFIYYVIFASFILIDLSLRAENELPEGTFTEVGGNPNDVDDDQQQQQEEQGEQPERTGQIGTLEKFIDEIPEVNQAYQECNVDQPPITGGLGNCIWERLGQIDQSIQERITNSLAEAESETSDGRRIAGFERNDLSTAAQTSDSVTRAFGDLMHKRMKEIIFGDAEKAEAIYDHTKFNEIYRSQLGKNLTESIAAFCLNVKYDSPKDGETWVSEDCATRGGGNITCAKYPTLSRDFEPNKQANKDLLKDPARHQEAEEKFNDCSKFIANTCSHGSRRAAQEACGVVRHLKNTKQALLQLDQIDEQWAQRRESATTQGFDIGKRPEDFKVDDIVNVASGEVDSEEVNEADQARRDRAQECADAGDPEGCAEFTITQENKDRMLSEYTIRKEAQYQRLKKELEENGEDAARMYLAEEGLTEEQIDQIINDPRRNIVEEIRQRYESEKNNLINSLKDRLSEQQAVDPDSPFAQREASAFFNTMAQQSRADEIKEVIHYSNVVSSFFRVCAAGMSADDCRNDDSRRNTAALRRELENSFFSPDNASGRDPSSTVGGYNQDEFQGLSELADGGSGDDETKNLEIDEINNLLYDLSSNGP